MAKKKTSIKREEVDIKVPKKLEREISVYNRSRSAPKTSVRKAGNSTIVGLNTASSRKMREHIHSVVSTGESMTVKGHCLLDVCEVPTSFPVSTGSLNTYVMKRLMVHPASLISRRLALLASLYSKYRFKRLEIEYCTETNATTNGAYVVAFTKDYAPIEPKPGVDTLSWVSELDQSAELKVWENKKINYLPTKRDLPSYYLSRTVGEIETVYQAMLVIVGVGLAKDIYYGNFYINYELELSCPYVPPIALGYQSASTLGSAAGTKDANYLRWTTTNAGQVAYFAARQGIYLCTLAMSSYSGFAVNNEYMNRNYYGTSFIVEVQGVQPETGWTGQWDKVQFTIYPNLSACLAANMLETTGTWGTEDMIAEMTMLMSTDSTIPNATIVTAKRPVVNPVRDDSQKQQKQIQNESDEHVQQRLGIGIGVGPGVLSGEPDIQPSLGFSNGRLVMGNPYNHVRY